MPASRPHPTPPTPHPRDASAPAELVRLAVDLAASAPGDEPPTLVIASLGHPSPDAQRELRLTRLDADDPVAAIVGLHVPFGTDVVGVVANARSRSVRDGRPCGHGRLVHLLSTDGVSVTVLPGPDQRLIGPTTDVQTGRVPDACRRLVGLPTAPPPPAGLAGVTHLWLSRVLPLATGSPGLRWGSVLAAHPFVELLEDAVDEVTQDESEWAPDALPTFADVVHGAADTLTPATVVGWSARCAEQWDWSRLRRRVTAGHTEVVGDAITADHAAWMDDGMFARWLTGELPDPRAALDTLEATLDAGALDRLWATICLSGLSITPPR